MAIGMRELAKKLNLSVSTISRVINGGDNVRPETCRLVMQAIEESGYIPNIAARTLKSNKSSTIGIVVADLSNTYYTSIISSIENYMYENGYSVLLCNYNEDYDRQIESAKLLLSHTLAGLIIAPIGNSMAYYKLYQKKNVPVIFIDSVPEDLNECNSVMIDNAAAAARLANHMIDMYKDNILVIATSEGYSKESQHATHIIRLKSVLNTFSARGYSVKSGWNHICNVSDFDSGHDFTYDFLAAGNRPEGIIVTTNNVAYGAIAAIQDFGLNVPGDIGIACFDAIDDTRLLRPKLTTINQPTKEIGKIAAKMLLDKISDPSLRLSQKVFLEPIFHIRESCGYFYRREMQCPTTK